MERMGSRAALRASHCLARSLPCEPRLWQRPQSARAEADLTRLGWQCGQRRSLCVAAQRSRLVFSGPLHGCLGCQGARTHAPAISRGAVAGFVPFSSSAHSAPRQMSGIVAFELGTKEWWLPPPLTPTRLVDSRALRRWSGRADRSSVLVPLCD